MVKAFQGTYYLTMWASFCLSDDWYFQVITYIIFLKLFFNWQTFCYTFYYQQYRMQISAEKVMSL